MASNSSIFKGKIYVRICSYLLKVDNEERDNAMDAEQEARLTDEPVIAPNADIQDALMSSEEVKKEKTKTPSTGM